VVDTLGNGRFRVGARLAYAAQGRRSTWVFIDGRTYVIEAETRDASDRPHATDDQLALSAPMPATVVTIEVTPGQEVAAGDLLVMLEAMKMELAIRAPRAGRVKALACREGELVQPACRWSRWSEPHLQSRNDGT
jgi:3-methylcrotonyl-CoA carboxylase alpha subunit